MLKDSGDGVGIVAGTSHPSDWAAKLLLGQERHAWSDERLPLERGTGAD